MTGPHKHTQSHTIGHGNHITYTLTVLDRQLRGRLAFKKGTPELLSRRPLWFLSSLRPNDLGRTGVPTGKPLTFGRSAQTPMRWLS